MGVKEFFTEKIPSLFEKKAESMKVVDVPYNKTPRPQPTANYRLLFTSSFDGEKTLGGVGPVKIYALDYGMLRARSWQSYLENGVTQTVLKKYMLWMIGPGLKLQSEPSVKFFATEGIKLDAHKFSEDVEARWNVFARSKRVDFAGMVNLNKIQQRAYMNVQVGGDVLVILRVVKGQVTVQLIDGEHVQSPTFGSDSWPQELSNGNLLKNGIETDESGQHVAYYVKNDKYKYERIPARGKSGLVMAYMVFGLEYRLDNVRGLPLISTVLEKLAKMDRYEEATIGSAEERQKVAYFFEHQVEASGTSPFMRNVAKARDFDGTSDKLPVDSNGRALAEYVAATTQKQTFNLEPGSTVKQLESKNELHFKEFNDAQIDLVCANGAIPPNVAMSKYDDSFSASRAATKDWEHVLNVGRVDFSGQFLQPIYTFWLHVQILLGSIQAPGYLKAFEEDNDMVLSGYRNSRWIGPNFPHIDPLKEVNAERAKLGDSGKDLPMTTLEAATENLNGGESFNNLEQYANELKKSKELGIVSQPTTAPAESKKKSEED